MVLLATTAWTQTVTPTSLDFGSVATSSMAAQNVTLNNSSTTAITITGLGVSGSGFGIGGGLDATAGCQLGSLAAGAPCTIQVIFAPSALGAFSGVLTVNTSAGVAIVALTGTGVAPPPGEGTSPITLSPSAADFGPVMVGNTQMAVVTLNNPTSTPYDVRGIAATGIGYSFLGCGLGPLAAQSSCTLEVFFGPEAAGDVSGKLSVSVVPAGSNTLPASVTIPLTGQGVTTPAAGADFSLAASQVTVTGSAITSTLALAPVNGFTGPVSFSCPALPAGDACAFTPSTVTLGSGSAQVQVTINSAKASLLKYGLLGSLVFGGVLLPFSSRGRRAPVLLIGALAFCLCAWACGGAARRSNTTTAVSLATGHAAVVSATATSKQHVVVLNLAP